MAGRVAVLVWEENRPWVSALRQKGYSVPWVEEPKNDLHKQIPSVEPDMLLVDMTRQPERAKDMVADLAKGGHLRGVPVIVVSDKKSVTRGLASKVDILIPTTPGKIIATVKSAMADRPA